MKKTLIVGFAISFISAAANAIPAHCNGLRTSALSILAYSCQAQLDSSSRPLSRTGNCAKLQDEAYRVAAEVNKNGLKCSGQDLKDTQDNIRRASNVLDAAIRRGFE